MGLGVPVTVPVTVNQAKRIYKTNHCTKRNPDSNLNQIQFKAELNFDLNIQY